MSIIDNGPEKINHINDPFNGYDGPIGIELRGQSSLSLFPKKAYGLETRDSTGGNLNVEVLGMPKENDWVLHGPYSDKSLIRNALTYIIAGKMMDYAPRVQFVELIINGDYQGVYLFTEKIKRDKNRVNIQKLEPDSEDITGGYIIKFDKGDEIAWTSPFPSIRGRSNQSRFLYHYPKEEDITESQKSYIQNFITEYENTLNGENFDDPNFGYRQYIDVASFIDFLIVNEISKNVDGYRLSSYMYKDSDQIDGRLKKGPVWDFNLAFGNANYCGGDTFIGWAYEFNNRCPDDFWVIHFWWQRLLEDLNFRKEVKERWQTLRTTTLSTESIVGIVDSLENLLNQEGAANRNFQEWDILREWIWPNVTVANTYAAEVDYLRSWTIGRLSWLDRQFEVYDVINDGSTLFNEEITVYPNPSNEIVNFDFSLQSFVLAKLDIYNALGQLVVSETVNEIDQSNLFEFQWQPNSPGVYFYKITSLDRVFFEGSVLVTE